MIKIRAIFWPGLLLVSLMAACSGKASSPQPFPETPAATETPTGTEPSQSLKRYTNSAFGLSFQYPSEWFGPDEYVSDQTLRVAVGSDKVVPYGESLVQPSDVRNSYLVVVQYSKKSQDQSWKDTYSSLSNLKDGESLSGPRSLIIRVKQIDLGRFKGFEYIATLSETAQTDHVYSRSVVLVDDQANLLTILGTPNNVEVSNGADWRDVYRKIDEANQPIFEEILATITVN
jgi:hypothetical protein